MQVTRSLVFKIGGRNRAFQNNENKHFEKQGPAFDLGTIEKENLIIF